jgi:sec-independent protein translocase protein TatB
MSFPDTVVLFILALLLFGPKKLPQIARQVGKALAEFKRASNEFKAQIESEISQLEYEERRKEREQEALKNPKPVQEAVQSSRFSLPVTEVTTENEARTEKHADNPSLGASGSPTASPDVSSPAHSTHA